jgi:hypothetical protein
MSTDLIYGESQRSWSRGEAPAFKPRPPTEEEILEAWLRTGEVKKPSRSVQKLVVNKLEEVAPATTKLVRDLKPRYSGKVLKVRFKL